MEITRLSTKSVLKKPAKLDFNKGKKVTFNNTVKVFIDDRNKNTKIDNAEVSDLKFIEISIVDKSNDIATTESSYDDCKVTDFLVHKVIYDNYVLPDDDDLDFQNQSTEDNPVFESGLNEEGLEFVVHKVTEHEDDLIKKDSDFNLNNDEGNGNIPLSDLEDKVVTTFSKLSIENIIEHDKIIAFIDQKSLGLSSLNKTSETKHVSNGGYVKSSDYSSNNSKKVLDALVLSPPLQELSLEKIVKAHSDNILYELDISPLNSVQETDSDSDVSSEGTMIMMTSEECQKNEQHIRESLLQYQSMKEKLTKAESVSSDSDFENSNVSEKQPETVCTNSDTVIEVPGNLTPEHSTFVMNGCVTPEEFPDFNKTKTTCDMPEKCSLDILPSDNRLFKRTYSSSLPDADLLHANYNNLQSKHLHALKRASSESSTHFKGKALTPVEIPNDVREWKILLGSLEKSPAESNTNSNHNVQSKDIDVRLRAVSDPNSTSDCSIPNPTPKSDELENFVHESTERVERIRKRYHLNGRKHSRHGLFQQSPVRGIRPRFGSTAEILQLMHKQTHPPFITLNGTKNHMSWPCEDTSSNHELERTMLYKHSSVSQSLSSECSSQSSIDSYCEDQLNTSCDHCSISSCPSIMVHERGTPEGGSPPMSSADINVDASCSNDNSSGFVYFSMKV